MATTTQAEHIVFQLIRGSSEISGFIGDRVFPLHAPQNAVLPYIVYGRTGTDRQRHLTGTADHVIGRVEVAMFGRNHADIADLGSAVRRRLDSYVGTVGDEQIARVYLEDESEDYFPPDDARDDGVYQRSHDYIVHFQETTTSTA